MPALNVTVHVRDKDGKDHVYGPGKIPPAWAVAAITNPDVWADDERDAVADPATPNPTPDADPGDNGGQDDGDAAPVVKVDEMTVPQLREYAQAHDIDLAGATKRAEILAVITAAIMAGVPDDDDANADGADEA